MNAALDYTPKSVHPRLNHALEVERKNSSGLRFYFVAGVGLTIPLMEVSSRDCAIKATA